MTFKLITRQFTMGLLLIPALSQAFDCSTATPYEAPLPNISLGEIVENNGAAYKCNVSGWCAGAAWAYEPGVGQYWEHAWTSMGTCASSQNFPPQFFGGVSISEAGKTNHRTLPAEEVFYTFTSYALAAYVVDSSHDLVRWEMTVTDPAGNVTVLLNETSEGENNGSIVGDWRPELRGTYTVEVKAEDSAGVVAEASGPIQVTTFPVSAYSPEIVYLNEYTSTSATSWSTSIPSQPALNITPWENVRDAHMSPSSSSSSSGSGYNTTVDLHWRPIALGTYITTASYDGKTVELETEVVPADGVPVIRHNINNNVSPKNTISVRLTALDKYELTGLTLQLNGTVVEPTYSTQKRRGNIVWRIDSNYYSLPVRNGDVVTIAATDNEGNIQLVEHIVDIAGGDEDGECAQAGIDVDSVNEYPNWTQVDWKGDPEHAVNGDLMQHGGSIYKAKWWTTSIPGSDSSWELVCGI